MSPKISKRLNVPANLDGSFFINLNFCDRSDSQHEESENVLLYELQNEIERLSIANTSKPYQPKRKQKQSWKEKKPESQKNEVKGAENIIGVLSKMPYPLLKEISLVKSGKCYNIDLGNKMVVECSKDSLLLYGRYIKLSREVS